MKTKSLFIALLLYMGFAAMAQDTVRYPDRWYGYTPREGLMEFTGIDTTHPMNEPYYIGSPNGRPLPFYYLVPLGKDTTKLYGIAVTGDEAFLDTFQLQVAVFQGLHVTSYYLPMVYDSSDMRGYFDNIYTVDLAEAPLVKNCKFEYDYTLPTTWSNYSHCLEIYFDSPIVIPAGVDGYVGFNFSTVKYTNDEDIHRGRDTSRSQYPLEVILHGEETQITNYHRLTQLWYRNMGYTDCYWGDCYWGAVFPIIEPRCTAPRCLHIDNSDKPTAVWCGDTNADVFQISVVAYPTLPDNGTLVTTNDTSFALNDLSLDSNAYCFYLRKMCTFKFRDGHTDTVWSDWSAPLVISGDTTGLGSGSEGIDGAWAEQFTLSPNPASGQVTVSATQGIRTIEVYDARGTKIYSQSMATDRWTLTTDVWPAGQYMVTVETAAGTTSKVLSLVK